MQICKRHKGNPQHGLLLTSTGGLATFNLHAFQFQKSPSLEMFLRSEQVVLGLPARRDGSGASFEASSSCQNLHLRDADKVSCPAGSRATQQSKTCAANKLSLRSEVQRLRPTRAPMALQGEGGRERVSQLYFCWQMKAHPSSFRARYPGPARLRGRPRQGAGLLRATLRQKAPPCPASLRLRRRHRRTTTAATHSAGWALRLCFQPKRRRESECANPQWPTIDRKSSWRKAKSKRGVRVVHLFFPRRLNSIQEYPPPTTLDKQRLCRPAGRGRRPDASLCSHPPAQLSARILGPDLGKSAVEVGRCRRQVRRAAVGGSRVLGRGLDVGLPGLLVGLGHLRKGELNGFLQWPFLLPFPSLPGPAAKGTGSSLIKNIRREERKSILVDILTVLTRFDWQGPASMGTSKTLWNSTAGRPRNPLAL